jgi:NAD(P)-dependent dehydrogenase (short-subunit alcohol dehydrogenase family)
MSLDLSLQERVALVSGGSGAIGGAIVAELRTHGARVVSLDTRAAPADVPWLQADVTQDGDVALAVKRVLAEHGRLDIVVHAAGVSRDAVIWKLEPGDWDLVHSVNLRGAFLLLRHAIPAMRADGGRVVLIGSINGARGKFGLSAYASSKAGLVGLAKSVARETARFGILVNVVEPGMVRTPMTERLPAAIQDAAVQESLLGRSGEPEDVAAAVTFLCGPGSRHVTGQVLRVDGGQYL